MNCSSRTLLPGYQILYSDPEPANGITMSLTANGGSQFTIANIGTYVVITGAITNSGSNDQFRIKIGGSDVPGGVFVTDNTNAINPTSIIITTTVPNSVLTVELGGLQNSKMCQGGPEGNQAFITIFQIQ